MIPKPSKNDVPTTLPHETHLFGVINDKEFDLKGSGVGNPYDGSLNTCLRSTRGSVHFPMHILSPIAIMGYPTYSRYQDGATDLFKISNGYAYTRELTFDCGGTMRTNHDIERTKEGIKGEFEVCHASVNAPSLIGIEPCVETFLPSGPGLIRSFFRIRWLGVEGQYCADVKSEYRLRHDFELDRPHFRLVEFKTEHTQELLQQDELLLVVNDFGKLLPNEGSAGVA